MSTREKIGAGRPKHAPVDEVVAAVDQLLRDDLHLLLVNSSERSIAHRLAVYLEARFPGWHVDCEYNRHHDEAKRLTELRKRWRGALPEEEEQGSLVLPDIIVHRRGTDDNLLVIEMKKSSNKADHKDDRCKLKCYLNQLGYNFALFLCWQVGKNAGLEKAEWIPRD